VADFFVRCWRLAALGLLVMALCAPVAHADLLGSLLGGNCPSGGTKVFASWGDSHLYWLAPNGGLENGSTGWSLSGGASVVSGNEPFYASGSHSLSLPSGSTATSPVTCIGPQQLAIRMFGRDSGGTDSGLHVRVLWYGLLNKLLGASDYNTFPGGGVWNATAPVSSGGGCNVLLPLLGSTSARIQVTPLGSGSNWKIDDLYVDPWANSD
jgi:hypothetical protein